MIKQRGAVWVGLGGVSLLDIRRVVALLAGDTIPTHPYAPGSGTSLPIRADRVFEAIISLHDPDCRPQPAALASFSAAIPARSCRPRHPNHARALLTLRPTAATPAPQQRETKTHAERLRTAAATRLSAISSPPVINRADVDELEVSEGDIAFHRRRLGAAAGCRRIGASVYMVPAGARQMPVHVHGDEEEIFYVLSGGGLGFEKGEAYPVSAGDVVVHPPRARPHTFLAGEAGLELLAFGSGSETGITFLPRAQVMWCGPRWVPLDSPHPFRAEGLAGPLERPEIDPTHPRPANVVALHEVQDTFGGRARALGRAAGAVKAGLSHVTLGPGESGAPLHCHALEEELFYVLEGAGTLTLADDEHPLRAGDVVARPPSTGVAHALRAGEDGLTYLVYGTREPGDSVYYPRSRQVRLRGLGVTLEVP